ncbi:MAG: amidohydrolase family protein [Firmicutes bacterium]|nr:amidohydrolase family protein [Bacillota bacterium]
MLDTLIAGAQVVDPVAGALGVRNVGIEGGAIAYVGEGEPTSKNQVNAGGLTLVPGFVDIHAHEDPFDHARGVLWDSSRHYALMGTTTAVGGNCGIGNDVPSFLAWVREHGAPCNYGMLAPHGTLRELAGAGDRYGPAGAAQVEEIRRMVARAMEAGAFGVSFGLEYTPGATTREITDVARVASDYGGSLLAAHYRYDCEKAIEAIVELVDVGRETGLPFQVSHINSCAAFGNMAGALSALEAAREAGVDVMADCYPYDAFCTFIGSAALDPGCLERWGVGYDSLLLAGGPYAGTRCTPETFEHTRCAYPDSLVVAFVMRQDEVIKALRHPLVMVGSDGLMRDGMGHPRTSGTFPRVLGRFVRDGSLDFLDALRKMTIIPARRLGLENKGRVAEGADADLVLFDPGTVTDMATYENPGLPPAGIQMVMVRGEVVCLDGRFTGKTPGRAVTPA